MQGRPGENVARVSGLNPDPDPGPIGHGFARGRQAGRFNVLSPYEDDRLYFAAFSVAAILRASSIVPLR